MAKLVSNVYGDALFELAEEQAKIDSYFEEAKGLVTAINENDELTQMMTHPKIDKEEKLSVVENIFKGRVSDEVLGLMRMVIEKDHFADMADILNYFIARVYEKKNIGVATVTSAMELTDAQKEKIVKKLLETTDYKEFIIDYAVDAELIGGMVIRIGDRIVDGSVKNKLFGLTKELSNIQLKVGECAS